MIYTIDEGFAYKACKSRISTTSRCTLNRSAARPRAKGNMWMNLHAKDGIAQNADDLADMLTTRIPSSPTYSWTNWGSVVCLGSGDVVLAGYMRTFRHRQARTVGLQLLGASAMVAAGRKQRTAAQRFATDADPNRKSGGEIK